MSRSVPTSILNALGEGQIEVFYAVEILLDDVNGTRFGQPGYTGDAALRLWTGYGDREIENKVYNGAGTFIGVSGLEEVADLSAKGVTLTLSGMPASVLSLALNEPYQRRKVRIFWGVGTGASALPSELVQIASVPAQDNATWALRSYDASAYVGRDVRLVIRYQSGSSFTGDAQFDDFTVGGVSYDPENGAEGFQRNSDAASLVSTYSSVSWESLPTAGVVNGKMARHSGGTNSSGTGNTTGNTGNFYFYAETTSPGFPDAYYWLRSPQVTLSSSTVSFYSAQNGATCGPITAYLDVAESVSTSGYEVVEVFSGSLNEMSLDDGPEVGTISVTVDSKLVELESASNYRYTSESYKSRYENDTFFDFVAQLQDKNIRFGDF